ncbi:MAG: GNAT family N-acetyltransferase [Planctomycetia bacterium]|nr:GNAT family N-acetyltransferase [Planctomycetia bacterium]
MTAAEVINATPLAEPKSVPAPGYVLECAEPAGDRAEIERFWTEHFTADSRRFPCYFNNPSEPGAIWVLRSETGPVVGTGGLHTIRMVIDGESHRTGHAVNLAIDPKYRTAGPAIQLQRALLEYVRRSDHSLVCGVTDRAAGVLLRAGYRKIGLLEQWMKVLRSERKLQKHLKVQALSKVAALGLDFALWGLSPESRRRRPEGWHVELPDRFDVRFDRLWARAAPQFPIATERSAQFLDWRFRHCCDDEFQIVCLCDSSRELAGYAIYRHQGTTVQLSDLLYARPEDLEILIVETLRHLRRVRPAVHVIYMPYFGNGLLPAALRRNGFIQRPEQNQLLAWTNEERLSQAAIRDRDRWYLTAADIL